MNIRWIWENIVGKRQSVDKKQWLFSSFSGAYSDNPKALSEVVHRMYPDIKIIWALRENELLSCPEYVKSVEIYSEEYYQYRNSSGVIIDNVWGDSIKRLYSNRHIYNLKSRISLFLIKRKNQKVYSLWHGTPLKKIDRDQFGNEDICGIIRNDIKLFVGNEHTTKIMKWNTFERIPIMNIGMSRNDILFSDDDVNLIKTRLKLPTNKKVVLFAPTFRNDGKDVEGKNIQRSGLNQISGIIFDELFASLKKRFGGEWIFVCRFHYHVSNLVDWDELENKYPGKVVNGNNSSDMAEYLKCTDVLITDASSSMFDFALTYKPCFLFFPDIDNYLNKERGTYIDPYSLPFKTSKSFKALVEDIEMFDYERYKFQVDKLLSNLGNTDDGHASERIAKYIYEENIKHR